PGLRRRRPGFHPPPASRGRGSSAPSGGADCRGGQFLAGPGAGLSPAAVFVDRIRTRRWRGVPAAPRRPGWYAVELRGAERKAVGRYLARTRSEERRVGEGG